MKNTESHGFARMCMFLFFAYLILICLTQIWTVDLWTHLALGRWMLEHASIPHTNLFSYTRPDHAWVTHAWLFQIILFGLYKAFSFYGPLTYKILTICAIFQVLFAMNQKKAWTEWILVFALSVICMISGRFQERPELLSALLLIVFVYRLNQWEQGKKSFNLLWLVVLEVLWVNFHIYFFLGPLVCLVYLVSNLIQKNNLIDRKDVSRLSRVFFLLLVACLINANGLRGTLYPFFITTGDNRFINQSNELRPYHVSLFNLSHWVVIAVPIVLMYLNRQKLRISHILLFLMFLLSALLSNRHIIYFGVISFAVFVLNLDLLDDLYHIHRNRAGFKTMGRVLLFFFIVFFSIAHLAQKLPMRNYPWIHPGLGEASEPYITHAEDFLRKQKIDGNVFNDSHVGSWMDYHLYPDVKPFIDTRLESYGGDFVKQFTYAFRNEKVWKSLDQKYHFDYIILNTMMQEERYFYSFLKKRYEDPEWKLIYYRKYTWIFARDKKAKNRVPEIAIPELTFVSPHHLKDKIKFWWNSSRLGLVALEQAKYYWVVGDLKRSRQLQLISKRLRSWQPFENS